MTFKAGLLDGRRIAWAGGGGVAILAQLGALIALLVPLIAAGDLAGTSLAALGVLVFVFRIQRRHQRLTQRRFIDQVFSFCVPDCKLHNQCPRRSMI